MEWGCSSVVERPLRMRKVPGSNPGTSNTVKLFFMEAYVLFFMQYSLLCLLTCMNEYLIICYCMKILSSWIVRSATFLAVWLDSTGFFSCYLARCLGHSPKSVTLPKNVALNGTLPIWFFSVTYWEPNHDCSAELPIIHALSFHFTQSIYLLYLLNLPSYSTLLKKWHL